MSEGRGQGAAPPPGNGETLFYHDPEGVALRPDECKAFNLFPSRLAIPTYEALSFPLVAREFEPVTPTVGLAAFSERILDRPDIKRTIVRVKLLADTNTFLAVALNEPEKAQLVKATERAELVAPAVLPYELGNALSALVRRRSLRPEQALAAWDVVIQIPVELVEVDIRAALALANRFGIYAYDAYFLQGALQLRCPLLTLDQAMRRIAAELEIRITELS